MNQRNHSYASIQVQPAASVPEQAPGARTYQHHSGSYAQYQTRPASPDASEQAPAVRVYDHEGAMSITVRDGESTTTTQGKDSYQADNLARDTYGDNWKGTARDKHGRPTATITGDSLVTIDGVQARVKDFVLSGRLSETTSGAFEEATAGTLGANAQQPQADPHRAVMPDDVVSAVNAALEPISDNALPGIVGAAIGAMSGATSMEQVVAHVVRTTGMEPDDAQARVGFLMQAHQVQADSFLTHRLGIAPGDLQDFYAEVRRDPRAMQAAINAQINGRSMSAWAKLAEKHYFAKQPPTEAALAAAGYETRNVSGTPEVKLGGNVWASIKGAARAGLI